MISVTDTGIGMDEETCRHCFDPLFTTKGPFKGTGMGLAAARRLVEESGGSILCKSTQGVGSVFDIYLPAQQGDSTRQSPNMKLERPRGSASVLLAEDDEELRRLMVQVLGRNGYGVVEAESAEQALTLAASSSFDILVSDVVMNALSGPELARVLQNEDPSLRVLLTSGTADASVLSDLVPGTAAFLAKPFKPSQLIDQVHDLLVRRGPHT
jgi:CheY-like chemotaxis protein